MNLLILVLAVFLAVNMGASSFAVSFATSYGGKALKAQTASVLFIVFVILGALIYGERVSATLGKGLIPVSDLSPKALVIIFVCAGLSLFTANLIRIPQTTSIVTVAVISGIGLRYGHLNHQTLRHLFIFWTILPLLSYALTFWIASYVYPPRRSNFWLYEKLVNQQGRLKAFVILTSCYNAFSVGTNNVANVVGPLSGVNPVSVAASLLTFGVFYGLGSMIFRGNLQTTGEKIVPLGLMTASIMSIVSGSLILLASSLGIPQSFVMLQMGALFAIAVVKHGKELTFQDRTTRKALFTWIVNPLITLLMSFGLAKIFL